MDLVRLGLKLFPFAALLYWGIFSILEVFVPSLRTSDFNRWEVDAGEGTYVEVLGWRKVISPPRVIAQGYMSNRAACSVGLIVGVLCILIGILGVRHVGGSLQFIPDLIGRFWR
jgi:hypothetical protein